MDVRLFPNVRRPGVGLKPRRELLGHGQSLGFGGSMLDDPAVRLAGVRERLALAALDGEYSWSVSGTRHSRAVR